MDKSDEQLRREQQQVLLRLVFDEPRYRAFVRSLQQDPRLVNAHSVDIVIRKDGVERRVEADWLKELAKIVQDVETPPL